LEDYLTTEAETKRMVSVSGTRAGVTVVEDQCCRVRIVRRTLAPKQRLEKALKTRVHVFKRFYTKTGSWLVLRRCSAAGKSTCCNLLRKDSSPVKITNQFQTNFAQEGVGVGE